MTANIGFLTVRHHQIQGYFGGYLLVNQLARPLEFHCTVPIKPSRAQSVLYGPTLEGFLCGEQIARALVEKAKLKPQLVLTDCSAVLSLSLVSDVAVVCLATDNDSTAKPSNLELPSSSTLPVDSWRFGEHNFWYPKHATKSRQNCEQVLDQLGNDFDLSEPFSRIVEALNEAHPAARAA
jgi:hypothetical protein